ncbi:MAG: DUF6638 family protein [bacterium]
MKRTLQSEGLIHTNLFRVEGDLVEQYNRALSKVIGKETHLTSFNIDKRGESPEIEEELGSNYLQCTPSHRFMVTISPDQKEADLIHKEFSFDDEVMDFLYDNYMALIRVATQIEGLYGELNDSIRAYVTLEDLLLLNRISIELRTPSGFITKARKLQEYVKELQNDPGLLTKNDSEVPKKIFELADQVGDVRGLDLAHISYTKEIRCFYSRLFGGAYVFREDSNPAKTIVIYKNTGYTPKAGPVTKFIPLEATEKIIDFLIKNNYAGYSYNLIEQRLTRIEDNHLLANNYDVAHLTEEERTQRVSENIEKMPKSWHELRALKRDVESGYSFERAIKRAHTDVKKVLLTPLPHKEDTAHIVAHLLTRLFPLDYENMYEHNKRDLEYIFNDSERNIQDYIVKILTNHKRRLS